MYIWDLQGWPKLTWDQSVISKPLATARHDQGLLIGQMRSLGFGLQAEATLKTLTEEVVKTSEIEGEKLNRDQVRSSIARRLGMDVAGLVPADRDVEGIVEVMLDATRNASQQLTRARLFGWHAALFPTGRSGMHRITVGGWRTDSAGPMQVVSGAIGREQVHFAAPPAERVDIEMARFLTWFNAGDDTDPVLRSAIAHLWFVTIHPFDDGNGRIARAVADMALARFEGPQRFYSMSSQIRRERNGYYDILESAQKATLDVTSWLTWFLDAFTRAIANATTMLGGTLRKARFWEQHSTDAINERQRKVINRLFDGFEGKLTTSKWAAISKSSQDTAYRDILDLVERGILKRDPAGGRSASYSLVDSPNQPS
jgi:Fic family protein